MCRLRNIAMRDYQESVTTGQTHGQIEAGQSDPYVPLCFAGDTIKYLVPFSYVSKVIAMQFKNICHSLSNRYCHRQAEKLELNMLRHSTPGA